MKVWQWLEALDSHQIYVSADLSRDFKEKTGHDAPRWPEFTLAETVRMMKARGLGGYIRGRPKEPLTNGWDVAETLAETLTGSRDHRRFEGRGSRFFAALRALRQEDV